MTFVVLRLVDTDIV